MHIHTNDLGNCCRFPFPQISVCSSSPTTMCIQMAPKAGYRCWICECCQLKHLYLVPHLLSDLTIMFVSTAATKLHMCLLLSLNVVGTCIQKARSHSYGYAHSLCWTKLLALLIQAFLKPTSITSYVLVGSLCSSVHEYAGLNAHSCLDTRVSLKSSITLASRDLPQFLFSRPCNCNPMDIIC